MKIDRFFIAAALVIAVLTAACGGNGGNDSGWTFSVSSSDTAYVDTAVNFSTSVDAVFSMSESCGYFATTPDSRGGSLLLERSGSCELRATAKGTTKTHSINVVENPQLTFTGSSGRLPNEMAVGQSVNLTYTFWGANPDNRNLEWTVSPSDAGTVEETISAAMSPQLYTVKFNALKIADQVTVAASLNGVKLAEQTTKITNPPLTQIVDLGDGQITADANDKQYVDSACARMMELNTGDSEVTNWWMSPAPDGLLFDNLYRLLDMGYNAVPELTNITGGATAADCLLLWGHKDDKARIVKLPYPLIDDIESRISPEVF